MATKQRFRQAAINAGFTSHLEIRDKLIKSGIITNRAVALTIAHRLWAEEEASLASNDRIDLACWIFNCTPADLFDYKRTKPVWKKRS